ncbi:hypothetical protein CONCODRAFT_10041 [Conidiobolus coronatus NRRL 28638]|uniref:Uncharacterized protein n=1 Tax=Conidiobolus coronatus (strain ATCC 28846 / CBS 209.66 / NRRL 28638) TaxID=796925 RepID=A0A137NYY7_CONC2|nr:hypothetical protein CONCODRAFT_10041 [Conidiobolus coronatus NRRL 28638]|eukprot:KXN67854.1 hypothetical protein CONCODRAFT_10041 [Conidiobolus coronatus NRRL 28638]
MEVTLSHSSLFIGRFIAERYYTNCTIEHQLLIPVFCYITIDVAVSTVWSLIRCPKESKGLTCEEGLGWAKGFLSGIILKYYLTIITIFIFRLRAVEPSKFLNLQTGKGELRAIQLENLLPFSDDSSKPMNVLVKGDATVAHWNMHIAENGEIDEDFPVSIKSQTNLEELQDKYHALLKKNKRLLETKSNCSLNIKEIISSFYTKG